MLILIIIVLWCIFVEMILYIKKWPIIYTLGATSLGSEGGMPWPTPLLIAASCWPDSSREEQPPMNTKYIVGVWVESYWKRIPTLTFSLRQMVSTARPPLVWFSIISIYWFNFEHQIEMRVKFKGELYSRAGKMHVNTAYMIWHSDFYGVMGISFSDIESGLHLPITST